MKKINNTEMVSADSNKQEKSGPKLTKAHREHLKDELGGTKGVNAAIKYGARSIDEEEAKNLGFSLMGKDGKQYTSGLILPFMYGFSQLRCDKVLRNKKGKIVKYLSQAGRKASIMIFGNGEPKIATEGWKDALAIHINTGETTAAITGVHSWKLLPETIELIIYDADAKQNPGVWGPLIDAGLEREGTKISFFPEEITGPKGGACEYFKNGGAWQF